MFEAKKSCENKIYRGEERSESCVNENNSWGLAYIRVLKTNMRQLKISKQITGRDSFSIDKYLQEIGKIRMLKPEEEAELAKKVRTGDAAARERLVLCNLRFVVSVAKQYQNFGLTLGDLINEGNLGLLKAVNCFDETKGFKFISYAVWWIRQSILQAIAENARLVRLPLNKISCMNKVVRESIKLEQDLQREPTVEEIAERLQITPEEVREGFRISNKPFSMDAPLGSEEEFVNLYDVYISREDANSDVEKALNQDSLYKEIERLLVLLPTRDAEILRMFYGLGEYQPMSLGEIGEKMGLSSERVRQIKSKAIKKLKNNHPNKQLKSYL